MGKESRKLVLAVTSFVGLLLVASLYFAYLESNDKQFESWKQQSSNWRGRTSNGRLNESVAAVDSELLLRRLVKGEHVSELEAHGFACYSDLHSEVCLANKPVRIDNSQLAIYIPSNQTQVKRFAQPYARKEDETAMKAVTPVQILHGNTNPPACQFTSDVPAVVFSSGGFTGNLFHEFNEVVIPLFITCHHFRSHLRFVITDYKDSWVRKYKRILTKLSRYEVINPATNGSVHCFPRAVIGLKYHDNLALNVSDIPGGYSMFDFRQFLRESYNLKMKYVSDIENPLLLLISRRNTRRFLNEDEMVKMMEELGFRVIVARPNGTSNLDEFAGLVNSCNVMVGAHGAGMTNEVFLPAGAVVVQVVPLGLQWASTTYYGAPASEMGLQYLEYKIEPEESSLVDTYGRNHPVVTDPMSVFVKGYYAARAVYIDGQNLKINVGRLRKTLVQAMDILGY